MSSDISWQLYPYRHEGKSGQIYFLFLPFFYSSLFLPFFFSLSLLSLSFSFPLSYFIAFGLQMFCRFCTIVQKSGLSVAHFQYSYIQVDMDDKSFINVCIKFWIQCKICTIRKILFV